MSQNEIWTTIHGEQIAVKDMTEQHAKNTLNMLLRKRREAKEALQIEARGGRVFHVGDLLLDEMHEQDWRGTKGASQ